MHSPKCKPGNCRLVSVPKKLDFTKMSKYPDFKREAKICPYSAKNG